MVKQLEKETLVEITEDGRIIVTDSEVNEHDAEEFLRNYSGIKNAIKSKKDNLDKHMKQVRQSALMEIKQLSHSLKIMKDHIKQVKDIRQRQIAAIKEEVKNESK